MSDCVPFHHWLLRVEKLRKWPWYILIHRKGSACNNWNSTSGILYSHFPAPFRLAIIKPLGSSSPHDYEHKALWHCRFARKLTLKARSTAAAGCRHVIPARGLGHPWLEKRSRGFWTVFPRTWTVVTDKVKPSNAFWLRCGGELMMVPAVTSSPWVDAQW